MAEIYKGNCSNCPELAKYAQAREFVDDIRKLGRSFAAVMAHCQESYDSMMEYTEDVLNDDMKIMFGSDHKDFYTNVASEICQGPKRNWRLLGLTNLCQNPSLED